MTELTVLQAVRLKGRVRPAELAATLQEGHIDITDTVQELTAAGLLIKDTTLRISPSGRDRLGVLLAAERRGIDAAALAGVYNQFRSVNTDFKALVTDWQLNGDPKALSRLDEVHHRVKPIIAAAARQLPRLRAYSMKLQAALDKVKGGETTWLARPLIDSYHTVWFELHEELIVAIGLTREEAARADDAG